MDPPYSVAVIDLHVHPLPGVDDGPRDMEASLALVEASLEDGVRTLVATPHVDSRWNVAPSAIAPAAAALERAAQGAGLDVQVVPGAEVDLLRLIDMDDADRRAVHLGEGPWILLEAPHRPVPQFESLVYTRLVVGDRLVLAHPERSPVFAKSTESLERLVDSGALVSITAGALSGRFGKPVRERAIDLLAAGLVHSVASDAHDHARRPPGLRESLAAAEDDLPGLGELAPWLTCDVPAAILAGETIPPRPVALERRRRGLRALFPSKRSASVTT